MHAIAQRVTSDFPGQAPLPTVPRTARLNSTDGTTLPLDNIQGDILYAPFAMSKAVFDRSSCSRIGMKKLQETFYFFHINDGAAFKTALRSYIPDRITSTAVLLGPASDQPLAFVNLAFSQTGLTTLGVTDDLGDSDFSEGQFLHAEDSLKDDLSLWEDIFKDTNIHGVFLIGSDKVRVRDTVNT